MGMLHRRRVFTEPEARFFMVQLIGACHHMHTHQVIHRYLKLGSLFLNAGMSIKAGDFGIVRHCEWTQFEVDIWSIGVILYTFILGRPPFQTKDVKEVFPHMLAFNRIYPTPGQALSSPPGPTPRVQYILRPTLPDDVVREGGYLSGYGVTPDLKNMDYLALDDRRSRSRNPTSEGAQTHDLEHRRASKKDEIARKHPAISPAAIRRVPADLFVQEIGILATQLVFESPTPLQTLKHPVHGFPRYATSLTRRIASQPGLLEEVSSNSYKIRPGVSAVWLNGVPVSPDEMNPYSLLRLVRKERDLMLSLTSLGLLPGEAFDLITHPSFGTSSPRADATGGLFDSSERPLLTPTQLRTLAAILTCSQAPTVRRNMFNVTFVLDLSRPASLHFIANAVSMLIQHSYPIRLGAVPIVETEEGARMARVLYYLEKKYGRVATMQFFGAILDLQDRGEPELDWSHVQRQFDALVGSEEIKGGEELSFDVLAGHTSEFFEVRINKARAYAQRRGTDVASSPNGHTFISGKYYVLNDNFLNPLQTSVGQALQYFQEKIYAGAITDDQVDDIKNHFYDLPTTMKGRNCHIVPLGGVRVIILSDLHKQTGLHVSYTLATSEQVLLSIYVVADLDTEDGLSFLQDVLTFAESARLQKVLPAATAHAFRIQDLYITLLDALDGAEGPGGDGEAIDEHEFILAELLRLALYVDYADEIGRRWLEQFALGSSFAGSSHSEQPHSGEAPHHFGP
ncbi:hypothetical protein H4582DRAFT_2159566 [Lactarius indigo]|nr:hypothetical protein H4582DRAFT_2159566 [Lactarius indigo]